MIKDLLVSFKDNIKSKSSNPFLGTYAIVWCVRNWKLVYSFFFFDAKTTLDQKIKILSSYYTFETFISDLLWNILWALSALILSYSLINLSRFIVNLFEQRLTPFIYKITDSGSIVLKEKYDRLKSDKQELEIKLERERDSKGKMQKEINSLEEQIQEMFRINGEREGQESLEALIENEPKSFTATDKLFNKLKTKDLVNKFINTVMNIHREQGWMNHENEDEDTSYFIRIGLLEFEKSESEFTKYNLTDSGQEVLKKAQLEMD
jgi:hypothetical protein